MEAVKIDIKSEPNRPVFVDNVRGETVELRFDEPGTPATKFVHLTPSEARRVAYALLGAAEPAGLAGRR